jgi:hypothetical protein
MSARAGLDMAGIARRMRFLMALGANWGALIALQIVPALISERRPQVEEQDVLFLTLLIVGLQVGQTVAVQTTVGFKSSRRMVAVATGVAVFAGVALSSQMGPDALVGFGATVFGAALGYLAGVSATPLLIPGKRTLYQALFATRNVIWLLVICALAIGPGLDARSIVLAVTAAHIATDVIARRWTGARTREFGASPSGAGLALVGVLASLAYRNDVNLVRASLLGTEHFQWAHMALVGYGFTVAGSGLLVSQIVYPILRQNPLQLDRQRRSLMRLATPLGIGTALLLAATFATGTLNSSPLVGIAVAVIASLASPWLSAILHFEGRSLAVYILGTCAVIGLAMALASGAPAGAAFACYALSVNAGLMLLQRSEVLEGKRAGI